MSEELKKCAACGMKIPADAQICPYCRSLQPQRVERSSSGCLNIIGGIVLVLIILAAIGSICSSPESDEKPSVRQPAETEADIQQPPTTKPTTSTTQQPEPSNSSANSPSKQNTSPTTSGSSDAAEAVLPKDVKGTIQQESKSDKNAATTSEDVLKQEPRNAKNSKGKDGVDRQTKRQERKQERQAKKNSKQAERDKAE